MNDQTTVTPEDQEIRDLLHSAGARQELPQEDLAAIRGAARKAWQQRVAAEQDTPDPAAVGRVPLEQNATVPRRLRRQPWLALAASLTLVALSGWWWLMLSQPELVASVEVIKGAVLVEGADGVDLSLGAQLPVGAVLDTRTGAASEPVHVALRVAGGSLRLDAGSRVRLLSSRRVELLHGAVYFDSEGLRPAGSDPESETVEGGIEIETIYGLVRDIGTQFEVRLDAGDAALRVRVREGMATLGVGDEVHIAVDGEELKLQRSGAMEHTTVAPYGDAWNWVFAAAPVPSIEGQSLIEVLHWLRRETGWQLLYQDPRLQQAATKIQVYAPFEGLTPEEVLEVVMIGSGLTYRLEPGTLIIDR